MTYCSTKCSQCNVTCVIVDPDDSRQSIISQRIEVDSGTPHQGRVVIDKTIGKATEFRFAYEGIPITVILRNPSGVKVDVRKEDDVDAFVFKPEGLAQVITV